MSATATEAPTDVTETPVDEPRVIPKAAPLPLAVGISVAADGSVVFTSPDVPPSDVPRDGDEITEGDAEGEVFVSYAKDGNAVTVASLAQAAYAKDKSKVDFGKFNEVYRTFQQGILQYGIVSRGTKALETALADAMMGVRLSVTLQNGDPDYWGKSWAYRYLFDERIRGFLRDQGFSTDESKRLLDAVRTNYVRRNETVLNAAAIQETVRGTVEKQNGVQSAKVETVIANGVPVESVVITYDKTDKDGNPKVETWTPGDEKMPKPLANVIKAAARRADGDKDGAIVKRLPEKVIGKPRASNPASGVRGNESGTNERNYANEASDAFGAIVETFGHVAPLELVDMLHDMLTSFSDYLIGAPNQKAPTGLQGGPKAIGEALAAPGNLLLATGRVMAADGTKDDVAKCRHVEEKTSTNGDGSADKDAEDTNN